MLFLKQGEDGQGLSEYAWILVLVAMVLIVLLTLLSAQVSKTYIYIMDRLSAM